MERKYKLENAIRIFKTKLKISFGKNEKKQEQLFKLKEKLYFLKN